MVEMLSRMHKSSQGDYFGLDSVLESSNLFKYGKSPYQILNEWSLPASKIYRIRMLNDHLFTVFVKLLKKRTDDEICKHQGLIQNEYNVLRLMHEKRDTEEYGVAEPLECIEAKLALITKEAEGERLDRRLLSVMPFSNDDCDEIERGMLSIGKWLRFLYESTKSEERRCDVGRVVLEEIEMNLNNLMNHRKKREWGELPGALMNHVRELVNSINGLEFRESLCHGDFIPANILQSKTDKITVVDFTDSRRGIIYEDLARFWQWLDDLYIRRPWQKSSDIERMKTFLIRGFSGEQVLLNVLSIFLIKEKVERISKLVRREPGGFLGDFRKERRKDYYKRELLMMTRGKLNRHENW